MPLIINADDFGYCKQRNLGIIKCFQNGQISSATLLVNGYAAEHAANLANQHNMPIGLHFNITEGQPVLPVEKVSTLVNTDKRFYGKKTFWSIAVNNDTFFNHVHVERELKAQIEKFNQLVGYYPEFIDGHNHCHVANLSIASTFTGVISRWFPTIKRCRLPIQPYIDSSVRKNTKKLTNFHELVHVCAMCCLLEFEKTFSFLPKFLGMDLDGEDLTVGTVLMNLRFYTDKIKVEEVRNSKHYYELMVHPGFVNKNYGGCDRDGKRPDEFSKSKDREVEMEGLKELAVYL